MESSTSGKQAWPKEHSNTTSFSLSAVEEHLKKTGHRLKDTKVVVITKEKNNFKRKIPKALEIQSQSQMPNQHRGFELPALYRNHNICQVTVATKAHFKNKFLSTVINI